MVMNFRELREITLASKKKTLEESGQETSFQKRIQQFSQISIESS